MPRTKILEQPELSLVASFRPATKGITKVIESFFVPFLLVGCIQLRSKQAQILLGVTLSYVLLHFVILPNWQERWVAVFYLGTVVCATTPTRDINDSVSRQLELKVV